MTGRSRNQRRPSTAGLEKKESRFFKIVSLLGFVLAAWGLFSLAMKYAG